LHIGRVEGGHAGGARRATSNLAHLAHAGEQFLECCVLDGAQ
jgi:hypothetical protein